MSRDVVREYTWHAEPDRVQEIFVNEEFLVRLAEATGSLEVQCQVSRTAEAIVVRTRRVLPAQVPPFARPLVGETVRVDEEQRWLPMREGRTEATLSITFSGPLVGSGTMHLAPGPQPGSTVGRFALTFRANVPLVGGKIEALLAEQIEQYLDIQASMVEDRLTQS